MSTTKYQLVFSGKLLEGFKHPEVQLSLAQLLKIPLDQAGHLIQGDRFRIKKALEKDKAERLLQKIIQRGAECSVEPVRSKDQKKSDATAPPSEQPPVAEPSVVTDKVESGLSQADEPLTLDLPEGGAGSSDGPLTLDLPELTPEDDSTRPMAIVSPDDYSGSDEIVMESSTASVAEFKPEDDSENVGTFYDRGDAAAPKEEATADGKRNQRLMLLGAAVVVAVAAWLLVPLFLDDAPPPEVATVPAVPVDPQRAQTVRRLEQLNRSVSVWMIQYGSGFNPTQVTLERLQQDLNMGDQDMLDGWGTALRFEPEAQLYRVISAGPDKSFGTADDLKRETTTVRK